MKRSVALCAVVVALVSGCSSGDDSSSEETTTTSAAAAPSKEDAAARLLVLADLASADALDAPWVAGDVSEGVDITLPSCIDEDAVATDDTAAAKFVTQNDLKLPSLEEHLTGYAGDGASDAFDAAAARLDGCDPEFVFQGEPAVGTISRLDLPGLPPGAAAWRTAVTIAGAQVAITSVHLVDGDWEMSLVHVDIGTPDPAKLADLANDAAAKL